MRRVLYIIFIISFGFLFIAKANQTPNEADTAVIVISREIDTTKISQIPYENDFGFGEKPSREKFDEKDSVPSFWVSNVFDPMRVTLKHEVAYKATSPDGVKNNRSSIQLEYSKLYLDNVFLKFDSRLAIFWKNDHRSREALLWVNDKHLVTNEAFDIKMREAYLQTSFGKTSIKAGIQVPVWGESDLAAVTDVLTPMDYREPLIISPETMRIGQPMLTIDQYLPFGDFNFFFNPYPSFSKHPLKGDYYYFDSFNDAVEYRDNAQNKNNFEYGMRWKKTFGRSDISIMSASLIDNEYAYSMDNPSLISKSKIRYYIGGVTFNYAIGNFLMKGEVALKSKKAYNNSAFQIVKRNNVDASLGFEYNPSSTFTLSLEAANYHVNDWNREIQIKKNTYMLVLIMSKQLLNDNLAIYWITMCTGPYNAFFNYLSTSYKLNDHFSLFFDTIIPLTDDNKSMFWNYRDQKQVAFKIQYQF